MIADKIIEVINKKQNMAVVGLDPRLEMLPEFLKKNCETEKEKAEAILEFNKLVIDSIKDIVGIVKPQAAFYEQYGFEGMKSLSKTIQYAKKNGLLVILDGKRNDIGSTASAYANAYLTEGSMEVDMLTVTPYLGSDGIKPFVEKCSENEKGIFVLVKTSNPSSGEFQDRESQDKKMYEIVAEHINQMAQEQVGESGYSSIGAVVGATYPEEGEKLRTLMPRSIILVPGYGKQGGTADDAMPCFNKDGYGAVVNSSRGVIFSFNEDASEEECRQSIKEAALKMKEDLHTALKKAGKFPWN